MKADKRKRRTLQIQIDLDKTDERIVAEYHDAMMPASRTIAGYWKPELVKAVLLSAELRFGGVSQLEKQYPELYEAKRLYMAIESGDLSIMQELFPERYNVFRLQMEADILEGINRDTQKDLLKELRDIRAKLDNLQSTSLVAGDSGGIKSIGIKQIDTPNFDDDDLLIGVEKDENAGLIAANNFLASIRGLQK